jgi:hypothetical protein
MRVLHLTVTRQWFDLILSGEKTEEYREIKMYWAARLTGGFPGTYGIDRVNPDFKEFDYIHIKDGYNRPRSLNIQWKSCRIGRGNPLWGAPDKDVYIIQLGNILK